jgi:multiple sugar transport system substrate-binding protein
MKKLQKLHLAVLFVVCCVSFSLAKPLEIWIMPNGANPQGILESILADFEKQSGLQTKVVVLDWGEAWSRIHSALEKGEGPDVLQLGTTWVPYYASKGWLAPLDSYQEQLKMGRFLENSLKTTKVLGDSSYYAVPWFVDARVLMGNRKILDSLQIKPEDVATYEGFKKALKTISNAALTTPEGISIAPYGFPGKSDWNIPHNFAPWIWSEGGDFLQDVNGSLQSALLNKQTIIGIRKYLGFVLDTLSSVETLKENTANVTQRFNNGELAFILNTSEVVMQTRIGQVDGGLQESPIGQAGLYTLPIPSGSEGSVSFVGGSNLCLPAAKAKSKNAIKLLEYLTQPGSLDRYTARIGFIPPDVNTLEKWGNDSLYVAMVSGAKSGKVYPSLPQWGEIEGMLVEMFSAIWSMLDEGGYYTESEFYNILAKYHQSINRKLGYSDTDSLPYSLDEFIKIVNSVYIAEAPASKDTVIAVDPHTSALKKNLWMVFLGVLLVIGIGFGIRKSLKG